MSALDEWGATRARTIEKLADVLRADAEIHYRLLQLRAQAAADLAVATRLEAEKAAHPNLPRLPLPTIVPDN